MAVKVYCSACDLFIKDVEATDLGKLTGKEKCEECGEKIRTLYKVLDDKVKEYTDFIDTRHVQAKKKFDNLDAAHGKFIADAQSLLKTTRAELDTHLQNILVGRTTKR